MDQDYKNGDRIYRLLWETTINGKRQVRADTGGALAQAFQNDFPESVSLPLADGGRMFVIVKNHIVI